eukprot:scaffold644_cov126-Isochrysis_galbana.AAC.8
MGVTEHAGRRAAHFGGEEQLQRAVETRRPRLQRAPGDSKRVGDGRVGNLVPRSRAQKPNIPGAPAASNLGSCSALRVGTSTWAPLLPLAPAPSASPVASRGRLRETSALAAVPLLSRVTHSPTSCTPSIPCVLMMYWNWHKKSSESNARGCVTAAMSTDGFSGCRCSTIASALLRPTSVLRIENTAPLARSSAETMPGSWMETCPTPARTRFLAASLHRPVARRRRMRVPSSPRWVSRPHNRICRSYRLTSAQQEKGWAW